MGFKSLLRKARSIALRRYRLIKHSGTGVYCPCCGKSFKSFVDSAANERRPAKWHGDSKNIICPYCKSFVRQRMICDYLSKNMQVLSGLKKSDILMFAPEVSITIWMKRNHIAFTSADLYRNDVDLNLDIQSISFPADALSLIFCNHVLEHPDDYKKSLAELYRVLKPGGLCIISVPMLESLATTYENPSIVTREDRLEHFGQYDHLRIFGADFGDILKQYGFQITVLDGKDFRPELRANVIGAANFNSNKVFLCRK